MQDNDTNLLPSIGEQSFGDVVASEILRRTIVAVVYDRRNQTYLCQYWPEYNGLTCLLSGGIEDGEDQMTALKREISEETGYKDFHVVGRLGGTIYSHYYKAKTDEHFVKEITPYLIVLEGDDQENAHLEDDEKFENLMKSSADIITMMTAYEQASGSTLADHKEILGRGIRQIDSMNLASD